MTRDELEIKLEKLLQNMRDCKDRIFDIYEYNTLKSFAKDVYYMLEDCKSGWYEYELEYYTVNKYKNICKWFRRFKKELKEREK